MDDHACRAECGGRRALAGVTVTEVSRSSYALYRLIRTVVGRNEPIQTCANKLLSA